MGRSHGVPKSVLLATRVTPGINEKVKQMAFRDGLYVSEWIRQLIITELKNQDMLGRPLQARDKKRRSYSFLYTSLVCLSSIFSSARMVAANSFPVFSMSFIETTSFDECMYLLGMDSKPQNAPPLAT